MVDRGAFELTLTGTEQRASQALRAIAGLAAELKRAQSGAREGRVRDLRRSLAGLRDQLAELDDRLAELTEGFDIDEGAYLSDWADGYVADLLAEADRAGLSISIDPDAPDRLLCYPSVIRILPGEAAVEIDKKKDRRLRPSALVARLAANQQKTPRFKPAAFLAALAAGYDLELARTGREPGSVLRLDAVWGVLTLLPGARAEYSKPEFARDLYLLDQDGTTQTKDGRRLRLSASSGTRGSGVLTAVAATGQQQLYWGVAFA